jgi:hypothetical protein
MSLVWQILLVGVGFIMMMVGIALLSPAVAYIVGGALLVAAGLVLDIGGREQ